MYRLWSGRQARMGLLALVGAILALGVSAPAPGWAAPPSQIGSAPPLTDEAGATGAYAGGQRPAAAGARRIAILLEGLNSAWAGDTASSQEVFAQIYGVLVRSGAYAPGDIVGFSYA